MKSKDRFDHLRIASPCRASWDQMAGDDRVRHCDLCNLHVYNIARMTRKQTETLIANTEGRICARLYLREDGTIITRDCPVGLRAIRRRVTRIAGAVFATVVSLCAVVMGQKPSSKDKGSCQQQLSITRKLSESASENGVLSGTVFDPNGAVVRGAMIQITDEKANKSHVTNSNDEGHFMMAGLAMGTYNIVIESPGFKKFELKNAALAAKETVSFDLTLLPDRTTALVGILVTPELIDTSTPGTTIIRGELIRRLPIPK